MRMSPFFTNHPTFLQLAHGGRFQGLVTKVVSLLPSQLPYVFTTSVETPDTRSSPVEHWGVPGDLELIYDS